MKCIKCKSHRVMKFVDGHNHKRVFCKNCGISYLTQVPITKIPHEDQKTILGLNAGLYYRPGVVHFR